MFESRTKQYIMNVYPACLIWIHLVTSSTQIGPLRTETELRTNPIQWKHILTALKQLLLMHRTEAASWWAAPITAHTCTRTRLQLADRWCMFLLYFLHLYDPVKFDQCLYTSWSSVWVRSEHDLFFHCHALLISLCHVDYYLVKY